MLLRYRFQSLIVLFSVALLTSQHPAAQQPAAPQPAAQQPAQAPQQPGVTFRAEANFVEVHAIVTDREGAFVKDLTAEDFEIHEDGRVVKPTVFQLVDLPVERPFTPANASAPVEADVRSTSRTFDGRIYILLLDDLHTSITRTPLVKEARETVHRGVPRRKRPGRGRPHERPAGRRAGVDEQPPAAAGGHRPVHRPQAAVGQRREARRAPARGSRRAGRFGRNDGAAYARGGATRARRERPARSRARHQCAARAGGDRERLELARRRPGPPQGAAVLQRRHRLRHLRTVQPELCVRARAGHAAGDCRGAARERERVRRGSARAEPVRRRPRGDQRALRLPAARVRQFPRRAAGAAPLAGEPHRHVGTDRRPRHRQQE